VNWSQAENKKSLQNDKHSEINERQMRTAQPLTTGRQKEKEGRNKERVITEP